MTINIQNLENENHELQMNIDNCERRIEALQNNLSREADLHAFNHSRDDSNVDYLTMRSVDFSIDSYLTSLAFNVGK